MPRSSTVRPTLRPRFAQALGSALLLAAAALPLPALIPGAGPAVPGNWRNLGPDGGTIHALAVDPDDPNVIYAGGNGGVFRSADGGASWAPANQGLSLRPNLSTVVSVVSLALDPARPSTLYAALRADGVARSADGGATWAHVDRGILTNGVNALALDPANGQRLFAATYRGLYRTGDGGASWRLLTRGLPASPPDRAENVVLDPTAPQTAYAVFSEGNSDRRRVFKSVNGGATWRSITSGPLSGRFVVAFAVDPFAPQNLYAGCRNGLFVSRDGGATWRASGLAEAGIFTLAFHPTRRAMLYAGTTQGVLRSTDGGASWSATNAGLAGLQVYALALSPTTPRTLFAGTSLGPQGVQTGGVFKSTNAAASWQFSSRGLQALSSNTFAVSPKNPAILWLGTDVGLWKSGDRGANWTQLDFESGCPPFGPHSIDLDPEDTETAYLTTNSNASYAVCATHDGGSTWSPLLSTSGRLFRVRVDPQDPNTLWAAGAGIWKSADRGAHWTPQGGEPAQFEVYDLLPSPAAAGTVYALGSRPRPFLRFELLRTTDSGATWLNLGTVSGSGFFVSLALDPIDPQTLYSAERGTLRRSSDGGGAWSVVSYLFFPFSGTLGVLRGAPGRLYFAAQGDTVYESPDGGASWSPLGSGPDHILFQSFLTGDPGDPNRLYVGASGGSLLEFTRTP